MYTYSVSGYDLNNKKFSPCSIRSIRAVLLAKASRCFSKPEESFCGNSLVEEGEQCDAGLVGPNEEDACCDNICHLKAGMICSDKNSLCCRNCQLVTEVMICREGQQQVCKREAYCSGQSSECPPSPPQPDDTPCLDRGKCKGGECVPFCETLGLLSCLCDKEEDACKRCCRPSPNSTCTPIEPIEILRDMIPCIHGYCEKGECKKTVQDIVERFWDIIEEININSLMKFLHDNIVGTVIVTSLIVWIPASCLISYVDRKRKRQFEEEMKQKPKQKKVGPFSPPLDGSTRIIRIASRSTNETPPHHRNHLQKRWPLPEETSRGVIAGNGAGMVGNPPPLADPYGGGRVSGYPQERRYDSPTFDRTGLGDPRSYSHSESDFYHRHTPRYNSSPMHDSGSQGSVEMRGTRRHRPNLMETYTAL